MPLSRNSYPQTDLLIITEPGELRAESSMIYRGFSNEKGEQLTGRWC